MHIHIIGICGTFMGSLAQLAKDSGHRVTGCDANVYPPMSTQLEQAGIELFDGFDPEQLSFKPDIVVVGNVVSRGNPLMEAVLDRGLPYSSGPQWLAENILSGRWVLAVAGTHGKTSTSSMLAWILEYAGMDPGYLIGGVPANFPTSARLGASDFFIIEADEYDTSFFDKRSKFVHYRPNTLLINNLEFDHADIFSDLSAIQTQFHHVVRTVPSTGMVIAQDHENVDAVLTKGVWSELQKIGANGDWSCELLDDSLARFTVLFQSQPVGVVEWSLGGMHNIHNALGAIASARHVGVSPEIACQALQAFQGVKRRMELFAEIGCVKIYDDFAHHPSAISTTLSGLRARVKTQRVIAIIELRSNTMKQGVHHSALLESVASADGAFWYAGFEDENLQPSVGFPNDEHQKIGQLQFSSVVNSVDGIIDEIKALVADELLNIVIMSNGSFERIHSRLAAALQAEIIH